MTRSASQPERLVIWSALHGDMQQPFKGGLRLTTSNEHKVDYGNKVGMCIGAIYGVSKSVFNSADNALVEIRTYRSNN